MSYFADAGTLVVATLFGIVLFVVVMRVLLQLVRANFYNPICQALYKITNPVLMPLQKLIPTWKHLNLAGVLLAYALAVLWVLVTLAMHGQSIGPLAALIAGLARLIQFVFQTLFWIALVRVILSWFQPSFDNPAVPLLFKISDLVLEPFRRVIPTLGGFDLSPIFALLALRIGEILIAGPLFQLASSTNG
jgi:YggT family protein